MGGKSKAPPPPDYSGIAQASAASAAYSAQVAREQLEWAKEQYFMDREVSDKVINAAMERQYKLDAIAEEDRARYKQVFQPLEDQLTRDAERTSDPARIRERAEAAAGKAATDVSNQFILARTNAQDRLESYGIDPGQVRSAALDQQARTAEALGRAGAMNQARDASTRQDEATGRALRSEALNIGKGYPGQVVGAYGAALQQGQGAVQAGLNTTMTGAQTMGTPTQWMGAQNAALGTWGNALTSGYNAQMQHYNAKQQQSSGWGSLLGTVGGIGLKLATAPMGGTLLGSAFGFEEGGKVPEAASPSLGIVTDDVPAVSDRGAPLRLNAGEFVVPKETLSWFGEKHFQKMIEKAKEEKSGAGAKPEKKAVGITQPQVRNIGIAA